MYVVVLGCLAALLFGQTKAYDESKLHRIDDGGLLPESTNQVGELTLKASQLKDNAKRYESHHGAMMKKRLKHLSFDYMDNDGNDKRHYFYQNVAVPAGEYSRRDVEALSRHLLATFKRHQLRSELRLNKRSSHKKELRSNGPCSCLPAVSSRFGSLDADMSGRLSTAEVSFLRSTGRHGNSIAALVASCDHDADGQLSRDEWCCCFANVPGPCEALKNKAEFDLTTGTKKLVVGAYVPQCDEDGFFRSVQCHAGTGLCWCAKLDGSKVSHSDTRGTPNCEDEVVTMSKRKSHRKKSGPRKNRYPDLGYLAPLARYNTGSQKDDYGKRSQGHDEKHRLAHNVKSRFMKSRGAKRAVLRRSAKHTKSAVDGY